MCAKISTVVIGLLFPLVLPTQSFSAVEEDSETVKCPKGQVWSEQSKKCVNKTSEVVPNKAITDQAWVWAYAGD